MKKIVKKVILLLLFSVLLSTFTEANHKKTVTVVCDGKMIQSEIPNFIYRDRAYVSIKAFFDEAYQIVWDEEEKSAFVSNGFDHFKFIENTNCFEYNNRTILLDSSIRIVNGRMFVPVRSLADILDYAIEWHPANQTVILVSRDNALMDEQQYNSSDLYWLSRIICSESCLEPYRGKLAVGNVVLNRVMSKNYPDTIYDVIFDRQYAVQFEPTANGTIYKTPDEECINAAKECLKGKNVAGDCLYFLNPLTAKNNWIIKNCKYVFSLGNHDFYI